MFDIASVTDSRILLVDDRVANLDLLSAVLSKAGYTNVKGLSDSRDISATFLAYQPDLVMLDLHMPHLDGLAVMDQLASTISEDDYLPVVVITADNTMAAKQSALSRGANDFLSKPLDQVEVQLRVRNLLQTRKLYQHIQAQNAYLELQVLERTDMAFGLAEVNQRLEGTNRELIADGQKGFKSVPEKTKSEFASFSAELEIFQAEVATLAASVEDLDRTNGMDLLRTRLREIAIRGAAVQRSIAGG